jgi:hypothetical protein
VLLLTGVAIGQILGDMSASVPLLALAIPMDGEICGISIASTSSNFTLQPGRISLQVGYVPTSEER